MSHQSDSTGYPTAEHIPAISAARSHNDASISDPPHVRTTGATIARSEAPGPARVFASDVAATQTDRPSNYFQPSPTATASSTPVRSLGVQSILNPPSEGAYSHGDKEATPPHAVSALLSPRSRKRNDTTSSANSTYDFPANVPPPRRMLTPKSPTLRAASLGITVLPPIQAISGAAPQSFPLPSEGRVYTAEPGVRGVPALPPITAPPRPYPSVQTSERQQHTPQIQTAPVADAASSTEHRGANLPRPVHHGPEHHSPTYRHGNVPPPPPGSDQYGGNSGAGGFRSDPMSRTSREGYRAGSSSYQMTLDTDQGPMVVPVELDLLQASKVADEKRKRNAGASARFRARRKEKEKEASHTISSLKHDIEELRAQRDFYREERDVIRDFAARHVNMPLPIRPTSPASYHGADEGPDSPEGDRLRSDSGPPPQRQRTEDYQQQRYGSPPRPEQQSLHEYGRTYQPHSGPILQPLSHTVGPYPTHGSIPPVTTGPPPLGPRSQSSYELFRREPFERGWDHGGR